MMQLQVVEPKQDFWRKLTTPDFGMSVSFRACEPRGIRSLEGIVLRWDMETDVNNRHMYTRKVRLHDAKVATESNSAASVSTPSDDHRHQARSCYLCGASERCPWSVYTALAINYDAPD